MTEMTQQFTITGMDCAGCAQSIATAVDKLDGISTCELNFTTAKLRINGTTDRATIVKTVESLGYGIAIADEQAIPTTPEALPNFWQYLWQRRETKLALLGALLILPGLIFVELLGREWAWVELLSLGALVLAGGPVARSAWRSLRVNRDLNINVLMTIAAIGAVVIGAYTEAGMVMVLFALSEALEGYTGNRARHAIRSLMSTAPSEATLLPAEGGQPVTVSIQQLQVGDRIRVKPGERIPMDGEIVAGQSAVNQAAITGESLPIDKASGDEVFAGTINGEGVLEIVVTHLAADNTISRMIRLVEEAQEKRAPVQRFVDQFARWYTPAVVILAALVAIVPPLFLGQPFWNPNPEIFGWLYRGLALLVVACPCALVISTPVSLISAITNGARNGVLFKGGAFIEALSRVRTIALDKTGTLTTGEPTVVAVRTVDCQASVVSHHSSVISNQWTVESSTECTACDDLLAIAGAVEGQSEHPLARAIVSAAKGRGLANRHGNVEAVTALTGRGVTGIVDGQRVLIGSHAHFDAELGHTSEHCDAANTDAANGLTSMLISVDGAYRGSIAVADSVRESSKVAVAQLKAAGVDNIIMLTGDNQGTAQAIAQQVGVTDVRAELLPADKLTAIQELQTAGPVAMVGDGINDAPALAAADVGIAIGGATGTAQAMETADITLMRADLAQLPFAVKLSRAAMRTIRVNVALSIGIKLAFLVIVLLGWGTMWMAVLADMGTSLLVTLNGMRLLGYRT
ncbi:MAG: heavy metal translocating P-type ATPase [Caldilineaceae bacterium]